VARLALSTACGAPDRPLASIVSSFEPLGVAAIALHRHPERGFAPPVPVVAVFGDGSGPLAGARLLVVEGGAADPDDRERSLEELCRRLHGIDAPAIALRTPLPGAHPAPDEIALVREALPRVGYWHDAARGGEEFLEAAQPVGASFDPLEAIDLVALRSALGGRAPAVVWLPPGSERARVVESLHRARGVFGA
jgi:hypothetical protein